MKKQKTFIVPFNDCHFHKKLNKPNYKGFITHVLKWKKKKVAYGLGDLFCLAIKYNTPIPKRYYTNSLVKKFIEGGLFK